MNIAENLIGLIFRAIREMVLKFSKIVIKGQSKWYDTNATSNVIIYRMYFLGFLYLFDA